MGVAASRRKCARGTPDASLHIGGINTLISAEPAAVSGNVDASRRSGSDSDCFETYPSGTLSCPGTSCLNGCCDRLRAVAGPSQARPSCRQSVGPWRSAAGSACHNADAAPCRPRLLHCGPVARGMGNECGLGFDNRAPMASQHLKRLLWRRRQRRRRPLRLRLFLAPASISNENQSPSAGHPMLRGPTQLPPAPSASLALRPSLAHPCHERAPPRSLEPLRERRRDREADAAIEPCPTPLLLRGAARATARKTTSSFVTSTPPSDKRRRPATPAAK